MSFSDDLRNLLETEEHETVGTSFGGRRSASRKSFSVVSIRNWVLSRAPYSDHSPAERVLRRLHSGLSTPAFSIVVASLMRFSFLIELTNLTVGSTKMKTRWLPGLILMPQPNSFEPVRGSFEPGNDPRAASFEEALAVFIAAGELVLANLAANGGLGDVFCSINANRRVAYEFPLGYRDSLADPLHNSGNIAWVDCDDLRWLIKARAILRSATAENRGALRELEKKKLEVKVFKTDRALTGKDKTNRAKRWEVLAGDFQHATLPECWSAERKLTADLARFENFPTPLINKFIEERLIAAGASPTRCPVTLEPLDYEQLAASLLSATHGVSDYQIGHLNPLKRGGQHNGQNVCWQSANGNRIQGDLTIDETRTLLGQIAARLAGQP